MGSGLDLGVWEWKVNSRILLFSLLPGERVEAEAGVATGDIGCHGNCNLSCFLRGPPALLDLLASFLLLCSGFWLISPLFFLHPSCTPSLLGPPSFYAEPRLVSTVFLSSSSVVGMKSPSLSLTSEHFSSLEHAFGLWGAAVGTCFCPNGATTLGGTSSWKSPPGGIFFSLRIEIHRGGCHPGVPSPHSGKFNLGKVVSRPLLRAGFAEQKPI